MPPIDDDRDESFDDDRRDRPRRRKKSGGMSTWAIVAIVLGGCCVVSVPVGAILIGLMLPAVSKVRQAAARAKDGNNLKQLGLGYHFHADANGVVTGPHPTDPKTGKPNTGLSHRVALLPYVEQASVYQSFDLSQPWDSAPNQRFASTVVPPFPSPLDPPGTTTTRYQGFVGPGTMYDPDKPRLRMADVSDGLSNTILMVTADDAVTWSKPGDLPYNPTGSLPTFGQKTFTGGTNMLMADGSIRFVRNTIPETTVRALITRGGNEQVPLDW